MKAKSDGMTGVAATILLALWVDPGPAMAQSVPEAAPFDPVAVVNGIEIGRSECAALEQRDTAIWVEADRQGWCLRYYAGGLSPAAGLQPGAGVQPGATPVPVAAIWLNGDVLGPKGNDATKRQSGFGPTEMVALERELAARFGVPSIYLGRPGTYGSAGKHFTLRGRPLEARLVDAALDGLKAPVVLPFFMTGGWFTRDELPRRLAAAGRRDLALMPAFGTMPAVTDLAISAAREAALARGWQIEETVLVLAAHGSGRSRAPSQAAGTLRTTLAAALPFREVRLGFIEEDPSLQSAATGAGERTLCLPLFVACWGHVLTDVPEALRAAGYLGDCLAPLGTRPEVPAIIATALARA